MENETKSKKQIPRRLSGFNDFIGSDMRLRQYVINTFIEVYEKYGYEPLETPSLELTELMLGQSGEEAEKQYYRFEDNGGRDVMLKYENMISMCRAIAQNYNDIKFPYKRYQIQNVWRAEKVQKGRYRELTQCDADTIGSKSMVNDAEYVAMGIEALQKLGFEDFQARISSRKFLEAIAESFNIVGDQFYGFSMSIDKLEKIGKTKVKEELINKRGISQEDAVNSVDKLTEVDESMDFEMVLKSFENIETDLMKEALNELKQINEYLLNMGIDRKYYRFDPTIARGLASYTGPVWEFEIKDGNVGSVGGGGRYDNAIEKYININLPATGGSFGIERICDILKDREMIDLPETYARYLVTVFNEELIKASLKIAKKLRKEGEPVLLYPDLDKLSKQIKYADKKDIPFVVIAGPDEMKEGKFKIRDMKSGEERLEDL